MANRPGSAHKWFPRTERANWSNEETRSRLLPVKTCQLVGEGPHCLVLEEDSKGEVRCEVLPEAGMKECQGEGCSAEVDEVGVKVDDRHTEDLGRTAADEYLHAGGRVLCK